MAYNVKVGNTEVDLFDMITQYSPNETDSNLDPLTNTTATNINESSFVNYFSHSNDSNIIKTYNTLYNTTKAQGTSGFKVNGADIITGKLAKFRIHTSSANSQNIYPGCNKVNMVVVGGGGAGGGSGVSGNRNYNSGGGGGGGGISVYNGISFRNSTSYNVTVGGGGNSATYNTGNAGGATNIALNGSNYNANGGNGGAHGNMMNKDSNSYNWPTHGSGGTGNSNNGNDGEDHNEKFYGGGGGSLDNTGTNMLPIKNTKGNGGVNNYPGNDATRYGAGGGGSGGHNHNGTAQKGGSGSPGVAFVFFRYD